MTAALVPIGERNPPQEECGDVAARGVVRDAASASDASGNVAPDAGEVEAGHALHESLLALDALDATLRRHLEGKDARRRILLRSIRVFRRIASITRLLHDLP